MRRRTKLDKMFDLFGILIGTLLFHLGWILLVGIIKGVIPSGGAEITNLAAQIVAGLALTICIVFD